MLGLEIVRHYNSTYGNLDSRPGILGRGWKLSYETDLYSIGKTLQILQADGTRIIFSRNADDPSLCSSPNPANGRLVIEHDGNGYTWTWNNGRVLSFDANGKLVQIAAPTGEFVSLLRDRSGVLLQVTDPQGRQLRLQYPVRRLAAATAQYGGASTIASPVGVFRYRYGGTGMQQAALRPKAIAAVLRPNLIAVDYPDQTGRLYHYEDARRPTYLTGISVKVAMDKPGLIPTIQRISTYLYDINGRAVLTVQGDPARLKTGADGKPLQPPGLVAGTGIGQVTLDFSRPGLTALANSLGQKTVYRHAIIGGENRLLEVRGAGCSRCGETNVRYAYDRLGRLTHTTRLNAAGQPLETVMTVLDPLGRPVSVYKFFYRGGKPGQPVLQSRLRFGPGTFAPILVASPSVVPGRERITTTTYNAAGQPLTVTQTGWAPAVESGGQPEMLTRTSHYTYRLINGRSLLVTIDGPLANGPKADPSDSDITRIDYDSHGDHAISTVSPGGGFTRFLLFDEAGFPSSLQAGDGVNPAHATNMTWNFRGQLTSSTQVLHVRYRSTDKAPNQNSATTPENDAESELGWLRRWLHPSQTPALTTLSSRIEYDSRSHPRRITRADGTWLDADYDQGGRLTLLTDQDGNAVRTSFDRESRVITTVLHTDASHGGDSAVNAVTHHIYGLGAGNRQDLIGGVAGRGDGAGTGGGGADPFAGFARNNSQLTQTIAPNGASTRFLYDPANSRLAATVDALNRRTSYRYDMQGRIVGLLQNAVAAFGAGIGSKETGGDPGALIQAGYTGDTDGVTSITGPNGARTERVIDDFGRVTATLSPDSGTVIIRYDNADRPIHIIDSNAHYSRLSYDVSGHLIEQFISSDGINFVDSERVVYHYRGANLMAAANRNQSNGYAYDADGLMTDKVELIRRAPAATPVKMDLPEKATRPMQISQVAHGRDGAASMLTFRTHYNHDRFGHVLTQTFSSGETMVLSYRPNGLLASIDVQGPNASRQSLVRDIQSNPLTGLTAFTHGNGLHTTYRHDRYTGQLTRLEVARPITPSPANQPNQLLFSENLQHDIAGRVVDITLGEETQVERESTKYGYDNYDQLIRAQTQSRKTTWEVDASGNRMASRVQTATANPSTQQNLLYKPASNRLMQVTDMSGSVDYRYDKAGNPIQIGADSYNYDNNGRLKQVRKASGSTATYSYNALGERIVKAVDEPGKVRSITYYLYENSHLTAETDNEGNVTARYIYIGNIPTSKLEYASRSSSTATSWNFTIFGKTLKKPQDKLGGFEETLGVYALHTNHIGAPVFATDSSGQLVWRAEIAPYGVATLMQSAITLNIRLPGQYFDSETGTHYNYFRDYDPQTGRYVQSDPIGLLGGLNTYVYVTNQPGRYSDPRGLDNPGMGPYGPYYAWTPWQPSADPGLSQVCVECFFIPSARLAKTIADLYKQSSTDTQSCTISFGRNDNQANHTNRHLNDAGIDPVAAQRQVSDDINRMNADGKIADGLNKGSVNVNGTIVDYNAYRLSDGTINVGRMTPR